MEAIQGVHVLPVNKNVIRCVQLFQDGFNPFLMKPFLHGVFAGDENAGCFFCGVGNFLNGHAVVSFSGMCGVDSCCGVAYVLFHG